MTAAIGRIVSPQPAADTTYMHDSFELLSAWLVTLHARDYSEQTIRLYGYGIFRLFAFHGFSVHPCDLTEQHVAAFLASLGKRAPAKSHYARGIRSFCSWLHRHGHLAADPLVDIRPRPPHAPEPVRYERDEMKRILAAAEARDPRRKWAILGCLGLGTRRSEFTNILKVNIDWSAMKVRLVVTKGSRPRDVPIGPWAARALRELERLSPPGPYLLPIQPSTLNTWVHEAATEAGITGERKQRAHTLRATFASYLLDEGVPIHVVSKLLGHSSIASTTPYAAVGPGAPEAAVALLG